MRYQDNLIHLRGLLLLLKKEHRSKRA